MQPLSYANALSTLAAVILAAGEAKRFGSPKQLATYKGQSLLQRQLDCVHTSHGVDASYVVLGAQAQNIQQCLHLPAAQVLFNEYWQQGLSTSIVRATEVFNCYDAILLLAVDQFRITQQDVEKLVSQWRETKQLTAAYYQNTVGIPAIFPREYAEVLRNLSGDQGAKALLSNDERLVKVAIPNALWDADVKQDLEMHYKS